MLTSALGAFMLVMGLTAQAAAATPCNGFESGGRWAEGGDREYAQCADAAAAEQLRAVLADMAYGDIQGHPSAALRAKQVFSALKQRGAVSDDDHRAYLRVLFVNWEFGVLLEFSRSQEGKTWLGDQRTPAKIKRLDAPSADATLFAVDAAAGQLAEFSLEQSRVPPLIVVFSPTCNPCRRAVRAIEEDAELRQLFARCSLWVSAVDHTFDLDRYAQWNRDHPTLRGYLVRDWSRLGLSYPKSTPAFHVFKAGQVPVRIDGWPQSGNKAEILQAIGALKAQCIN